MASPVTFFRQHGFLGFREPIEITLIVTSALINMALWASTALVAQLDRQLSPLHYTIYFGIDLTVPGNRMYILPGFALLIFLTHLVASGLMKHQAWRQSWLIMNLGFQVILGCVLAFLTIIAGKI